MYMYTFYKWIRCEDDNIFDDDLPVEPLEVSRLHEFVPLPIRAWSDLSRHQMMVPMLSRDRRIDFAHAC